MNQGILAKPTTTSKKRPESKDTTPTGGIQDYILDTGVVSNADTEIPAEEFDGAGYPIPYGFGRRLATGVLIWSSEFRSTGSGETLASKCDFAVAFGYSGVPQNELEDVTVSKVFANGELIYDRQPSTTGNNTSGGFDMVIYKGTETQLPNSTIVAIEGANRTPAFRGMIYVVFRNFDLTRYSLATIPFIQAEIVDKFNPVSYWKPYATAPGATLPSGSDDSSRFGAAVDWTRGYSYFYTGSAPGPYVLRVYDHVNEIHIAELTLSDATGNTAETAGLQHFFAVDEATGLIFTTSGGLGNTSPIKVFNPLSGTLLQVFGFSAIFPGYEFSNPSQPVMSNTTKMRFATSPINNIRWAFCADSVGEFALVGVNNAGLYLVNRFLTDDERIADIGEVTVAKGLDLLLAGPEADLAIALSGDEALNNAFLRDSRFYFARGNRVDVISTNDIPIVGGSIPWQNFTTLPTGSLVRRMTYDDLRQELFFVYKDSGNVGHARMYKGMTMMYEINDVPLPEYGLINFTGGNEFSRTGMGRYAYYTLGNNDEVVEFDISTGEYTVYDVGDIVLFNDPGGTVYHPIAGIDNSVRNFIWDGYGGYFISAPWFSGGLGQQQPGRMFPDGIQNQTMGLDDFIRWSAMLAGFDPTKIQFEGIEDQVIGGTIDFVISFNDLLETLSHIYQFDYYESEGLIKITRNRKNEDLIISATLTENDIAPISSGSSVANSEAQKVTFIPNDNMPDSVSLSFADYTRNYQVATIHAKRTQFPISTTPPTGVVVNYFNPLVMLPSDAITRVSRLLYKPWETRSVVEIRLPPQFIRLEPSDIVQLTIDDMVYLLKLYEVTINADYSLSVGAITYSTVESETPTEDVFEPPQVIGGSGQSEVILIDSSILKQSDIPVNTDLFPFYYYVLPLASAGAFPGARVKMSLDGVNYTDIGASFSTGVFGYVQNKLTNTGLHDTTDEDRSMVVSIVAGNPEDLIGTDDAGLTNGVNYALVGDTGRWELIQFRDVEVDEDFKQVTLSGIVRGRRNTIHNMGNHGSADKFLLVTPALLPKINYFPRSQIGKVTYFDAIGVKQIDNPLPVKTIVANVNGMKPWAPTAYTATHTGGNTTISWQRRSMIDNVLHDGNANVFLEFDALNFEIDFLALGSNTVLRTITGISALTYTYSDAHRTTDYGSLVPTIRLAIYQVSDDPDVGRGDAVPQFLDIIEV